MSAAAVLLPSVSKEVRALAWPWLACLACMVMPAVANAPVWLGGLSVPAYFLGTAALGGLSMGHEYTDRTLSLLLTLPARRERLFAIKFGVLAVMLTGLWVAAATVVFGDSRIVSESQDMAALLPVACGLLLAPWLTMVCRNPIGGAVFALAIPGVLFVGGELIGINLYGDTSAMQDFRLTFVSVGTIALCAIGAVMGWWTFTRLEAIDGPGQDVRLPRWPRRSDASSASARLTRHHPFWLLAKKDMALQQLPIVLAAFYVVAWVVTEALASFVFDVEYRHAFAALTLPYGLLLAMLIGSSASATERQIGTLEWQTLLPIATWKQWAVKMVVVFGLALVLALGVPLLLLYLGGLVRPTSPLTLMAASSAITIIILMAAGSLYVSSLSKSVLRALVTSIPVMFGAMLFMQFVLFRIGAVSYTAARRFITGMTPTFGVPIYFVPQRAAGVALTAVFLIIVLRLALSNHRSAERPRTRVLTQTVVMAATMTAGVVAAAVWQASQR
jgi:hypothetical protein